MCITGEERDVMEDDVDKEILHGESGGEVASAGYDDAAMEIAALRPEVSEVVQP